MTDTYSPIQTYKETRDRWASDPLAGELTSAIVALAGALPILGLTIYGFSTGWDLLGGATLAILGFIATVYYLILSNLMKRRRE